MTDRLKWRGMDVTVRTTEELMEASGGTGIYFHISPRIIDETRQMRAEMKKLFPHAYKRRQIKTCSQCDEAVWFDPPSSPNQDGAILMCNQCAFSIMKTFGIKPNFATTRQIFEEHRHVPFLR